MQNKTDHSEETDISDCDKEKVKNWQNGGKSATEGPKWRKIRQRMFPFCDIILM